MEPYNKRKRDSGSGQLRLDHPLHRREEIYALLYAAYFRPELVKKIQEEVSSE